MANSKFRKPRVKSFQGLSLIEVSISIAILAIILASLSGIFNQGYRFLRKTRMSHLACLLAQEQMEKLINESTADDPSSFNGTENLSAPFQDFRGEVTIIPSPEGSSAGVKALLTQVNVSVYWQGQSGEQNFTLISIVAKTFPHT